MFWMRAYLLRGQVGGGWALDIASFLGPVKWHQADRRVPFGAQKTRDFQPPPTCPRNRYARIHCAPKWSKIMMMLDDAHLRQNKSGRGQDSTLCYLFSMLPTIGYY
jgi:hypothetical protein